MTAYALLRSRDIGSGLIAERSGRPPPPLLGGPFGLAWRLQRVSLLGWTVGLCLYALLVGSVVHDLGDEIGDSPTIRDIISRFGGTDAMENAFITISFRFLGVASRPRRSRRRCGCTARKHRNEARPYFPAQLDGSVGRRAI